MRAAFEYKLFGEYITIDILGQGSRSTTYLVWSTAKLKRYALKVQKEITEQSSYDLKEEEFFFQTMKKHPYFMRYVESIQDGMVFELEVGGSLASLIRKFPTGIPEQLAMTYFTHICLALEHMHSNHTMHNDLKSSSILISDENKTIAKIGGFGSTRKGDDGRTQRYFAPEKFTQQKEHFGKADVWSMGIILHEMLTGGQHPFTEPDHQGYLQGLGNNQMLLNPSISQACQKLIRYMLEKDPSKRPSIPQILNTQLVKYKIIAITEELTNGLDVGEAIRVQVEDLLTFDDEDFEKQIVEEVKEMPVGSTFVSTDFASQSSDIFRSTTELQLQIPFLYHPISQQSFLTVDQQQFTQSGFDQFFSQIREKGLDKLADAALKHGISLDTCIQQGKPNREVQELPFEGKERDGQRFPIIFSGGIYYGQCLDGVRDGFGLLQCTDSNGAQYLTECIWKMGKPTNGRVIALIHNKLTQYEGSFNDSFLMAGTGCWSHKCGTTYIGEWKDNQRNGQGKSIFPNGESYEGYWKDDKRQGLGKQTFENGNYQLGQWVNGKAVGVHKLYSAEDKLLEQQTFDKDGKLVKEKEEMKKRFFGLF
ncbi:hypothetical protein FGO68_gene8887 [Halteria grandinella]|uniref:Protein kinase domain-containing protein n=1 Tax=Halteria grandinella TaxID=5974 RepID=A0A8J8NU99_HALGN|nr:hypothetical protein FGO68_gene8887 [Halteria grandinella]